MHAEHDHSVSTQKGRGRALLAGGLVLGLGAAMTLAAWTDQVHVFGLFGTGEGKAAFQGNVTSPFDGEDSKWRDYHGDDERGELDFDIKVSGLAPEEIVYAPVALRTVADSVPFDVTLLPGVKETDVTSEPGELFENLRYRVQAMSESGLCDANGFGSGTDVVGADGDWEELTVGSATGAIDLSLSLSPGDPGVPTHLCFAVQIDPSLNDHTPEHLDLLEDLQQKDVRASWIFEGTSVDQIG